ncbi:MAG: hypothetical protein PHS44_05010, partial [Candidatus Dojkabacteria bacterium]|nr:hypothetical protein [Candidatus Dojkabacteria bacterium]
MNIATYFEQIAEILGYILTDVDKEYIAKYSNYVVIIIAIFTSIIVVSRIVAKIKAVNEYIDDGVALFLASTKEEKDISKLLFTILPELYDIIYDKFGRKEFFSLEVLLSQGIGRLSLFLPRKVYNLWASRAEFFRLKVVTEEREKFVDSMSPSNYCTILELAKDYIYPLDLEGRGKLLDKVNSSELMMFQMVCRPAGRRWEQRIEEGLEKL